MDAKMNLEVQNLEKVDWIEIIRKYQVPDFRKAVGQIFTSIVP